MTADLEDKQTREVFIPKILRALIVFVILFSTSFAVFYYLNRSDNERLTEFLSGVSENAVRLFEADLVSRFYAVDRMAERFRSVETQEIDKWTNDAKNYFEHLGGFQAIAWADAETKVRYIYPQKGNEKMLSWILSKEPNYAGTIKTALKTQTGAISNAVDLGPNGTGFLSLHPIYREGKHTGYIVGVYRADAIFEKILNSRFNVQVFANNSLIYEQISTTEDVREYSRRFVLKIRNIEYGIQISPSPRLVFDYFGYRNIYILFALAIASLLISLAYLKVEFERSRLAVANSEIAIALKSAEQAAEAKARFLAIMSHEIRTPMNAIVAGANILKDEIISSESKETLTMIVQSGGVLIEIIDDILDYSKLEAGQINFENEPINLYEILRDSFEISQIDTEGIEFTFQYHQSEGDKLSTWIYGDATRIRQLIFNLLSNAKKFTTTKIDFVVEVEKIATNEYQIVIEITDDGIGISEHESQLLFKEFSQVDASTTRKYGGTGLGLAICKGLIEKMGGTISVLSRKGYGARFIIDFTARSANLVDVKIAEDADGDFVFDMRSELKILMAEDNPINQKIGIKLLEKIGYKVDVVENGRSAYEAAKATDYDVVFMDLHMPELDGIEATKLIRKANIHQPIIFALTASVLDSDRKRCATVGMDGFIAKPIVLSELKKAISLAIAKSS